MGYYIQAPSNHGKVNYLVETHGAEIVGRDSNAPAWDPERAIICVVDNGGFEAAGYAYRPHELEAFTRPDLGQQRDRVWLKMDRALARKLAGYTRDD